MEHIQVTSLCVQSRLLIDDVFVFEAKMCHRKSFGVKMELGWRR